MKTNLSKFPEDVIRILSHDIVRFVSTIDDLGVNQKNSENDLITRIICYSHTADIWYTINSPPIVVYYAVLINSVHEYITDIHKNIAPEDQQWLNADFWSGIYNLIDKERKYIKETVKNIKPGEVVNIDIYHEKVKGELNAIVS
jgi:hypothetical protein